MYKLTCEYCKTEFESKKKETRFCSRNCYSRFCKETKCLKRINSTKVEVICAECGKHEFVAPSRAKKYLCCSTECLGKYNSKRYSKQITLICPICGKSYSCKQSKVNHHKTCGDKNCRSQWLTQIRTGINNSNYKSVSDLLKNTAVFDKDKDLHKHIVKEHFGFSALKQLPKGYHIHHKDANHHNNDKTNLVLLPGNIHMMIHRYFGNVLISALHSGKLSREQFFSFCSKEQKDFYEQIIDLDITCQVVVKQGELLENPEVDNQQPSIYRNIIVGSETNNRILTNNVEDSNVDTSALPDNIGEDIVRTACITNEDAESENKESLR